MPTTASAGSTRAQGLDVLIRQSGGPPINDWLKQVPSGELDETRGALFAPAS
jgi:hypothetical protein